MDLHAEMAELRRVLDSYGLGYTTEDSEDVVDEWSGFVVHVERTGFMSPDGRWFSVLLSWTRDEDGKKRYVSLMGGVGYLECKVGESAPYAAYAEEILEDALGHCK